MRDNERIHEASIFDIISRIYPANYKLVRGDHKALSPFTNERTPSFHVREEKGYFKCFSTGLGGDAITFVMEYEKLDYKEAVERIFDVMGWEFSGVDYDPRPATRRWFADFAHKSLLQPVNLPVLRYLFSERKLSLSTIQSAKLGFVSDAAPVPPEKAEELMAAGLVKRVRGGQMVWEFANRVVFPYQNISGGVSGFSGRQVPGYDTFLPGKYINSKADNGFFKDKELYGLYEARSAARKSGKVILLEGQFDRTGLKEAGILYAVAPGGTAFTSQHAKILHSLDSDIILWYDFDKAGYGAAIKAAVELLKVGRFCKIMHYEPFSGQDPDQIRQVEGLDLEEFTDLHSYDVADFMIRMYQKVKGQGKMAVVEKMKQIASACLMQFMADDLMERFTEGAKISDVIEVKIAEPLKTSAPIAFNTTESKVLAHLYGRRADVVDFMDWAGEHFEFEHPGLNAIWHYLKREEEVPHELVRSEAGSFLIEMEMNNDIFIERSKLKNLAEAMRITWMNRERAKIREQVSQGKMTTQEAYSLLQKHS